MKAGDWIRVKSGMFKGKTGTLKSRLSYHNEKDPDDCGAWTAFIDGQVEMVYSREIEPATKLKRRKRDG